MWLFKNVSSQPIITLHLIRVIFHFQTYSENSNKKNGKKGLKKIFFFNIN